MYMKKNLFLLLPIVVLFVSISCKKTVVPVSEKIKKNWTAMKVTEGSTVKYDKANNVTLVAGYSNFSLNLATPPSATLKEFDGNSFSGTYELVGDTKLVLKNLSPAPTGTSGTIEFTIDSITDTELKLTRTTVSQKTGGTINSYVLSGN